MFPLGIGFRESMITVPMSKTSHFYMGMQHISPRHLGISQNGHAKDIESIRLEGFRNVRCEHLADAGKIIDRAYKPVLRHLEHKSAAGRSYLCVMSRRLQKLSTNSTVSYPPDRSCALMLIRFADVG